MRSCRFIVAGLLAPFLVSAAEQRASVHGPVLGYYFDPAATGLRPILGLPGASLLGAPLEAGLALSRAAISPRQDFALALANGAPGVVALELAPGQPVRRHEIDGASSALGNVAFTPGGRAAALWAPDAHRVQIVVGLPASPQLSADLDLSSLPGAFTAVALGDSGTVLVAALDAGRGTVYRVDGPASAGFLWTGGTVPAMSFLPGQDDALIADAGAREVYLVRSVSGSPAAARLASEADGISDPVAVEATTGAVYVANASGAVNVIHLSGAPAQTFACGCRPAGLQRLSGDSVFRLTGPEAKTMWLLDAAGATPRVLFVPSDATLPQRSREPNPPSGRQR